MLIAGAFSDVVAQEREAEAERYRPSTTFIQNLGQWNDRARFRLSSGPMFAWFTDGGLVYDLFGTNGARHVVGWSLVGAKKVRPSGRDRENAYRSWIVGGREIEDVPAYREIVYTDLLPGIGARFTVVGEQLKYDLILSPGADPSSLRMTYRGADGIQIEASGTLTIFTSAGKLSEAPPVAWQEIDGIRVPVEAAFHLDGEVVGIRLGTYDRSHPVVIDPAIRFSTYLGGSRFDEGRGVEVDRERNVYVTGVTRSPDFPTTFGALNRTYDADRADRDLFIGKFSPTGGAMIWGTYVGGGGDDDPIAGIRVGRNGRVFVAGITGSTDFPTTSGTVMSQRRARIDGFVLALDQSEQGTRPVLGWGTYLGGILDDTLAAFDLNSTDNVVVIGHTSSIDFDDLIPDRSPIPVLHPDRMGGSDVFLLELSNDGRSVVTGTYLGGSGDDRAADVVVGFGDRVVATGWTRSDDLRTSSGAVFTARAGLGDAFISKLSSDMTDLDYGTYLGGNADDYIRSAAVDRNGLIYVTGHTESSNYPDNVVLSSPGSWFVTRIDPFVEGAAQLSYSLYLTSNPTDRGVAITVDTLGRATMAGVTSSPTFPIEGNGRSLPGRGGNDLALVRLASDGGSIVQSSVVGGSLDDSPAPQAWLSSLGVLHVTGTTRSQNFPLGRFPFDGRLNTVAGETEPDAFLLAWAFDSIPNLVAPATIFLDTLQCDSVVRDTFYLYNDGDLPLRIEANAFVVEPTKFVLERPARFPNLTVRPGDSVQYVIRYSSTDNGSVENNLLVFTSDPRQGDDSLSIGIRAARFAPAVLALPSQIGFGRVLTCQEKTISLTLFGDQSIPVTVEQPTFTSGGTVFRIESDVAFPLQIPKGGEKQIRLTYSPDLPVSDSDTVVFRIRECAQSILKVRVSGQGEVSELTGLPDSIGFPAVPFCSSERDTVITVSNNKDFDIIVKSTGPAVAGFEIEYPRSLPDTLAPRESVNLIVRFAPPVTGDYDTEALIELDPCDTTLRLRLVGSHPDEIVPVPSVDTLDFGTLQVCRGVRMSTDKTLIVDNPSDSLIQLGAPLLPSSFSACGVPFPMRILPRGQAAFCLIYNPPPGNAHDTVLLAIPYSVGDCFDTMAVVLVGGRSVVELIPDVTTVDLGALDACESFRDTVIVVRNPSVGNIRIDSTHISRGAEVLDPALPIVVPANDSVVIRTRFSPRTSGQVTESIRLFFSAAGCTDSLDLTLTGSAGGIVATTDRDTVLFDPILLCDPPDVSPDTVFVSWTGTSGDEVKVFSLRVAGSDTEFSLVDSASVVGTVIGPGDALPVPLRFSSAAGGVHRDTLEIVVEPCMDTIRVLLSGEVVDPDTRIQITANSFGNTEVRTTRSGRITVWNDSPLRLTLDTILFATLPFMPGAGMPGLPFVLEPGAVVDLPVAFRPEAVGDFVGSVALRFSGACDHVRTVRLTGSGVQSEKEVELCIGGLYGQPGIVGDTVVIQVRAVPDVVLDNPVDLLLRFRFDPARFQFVGTTAGTPDPSALLRGELTIRLSGVTSLPADLPSIRLRLLAGTDPFAVVRLDSAALIAGTGMMPMLCPDSAIVSIANRCFVTGLSFGKYPNRLERPVPNPVSGSVEITFQQLEDAETILRLWDAQGREVLRPLQAPLPGGRYTVRFSVEELPPGLYFYGVQAGSWSAVERMTVNR